MRTGRSGPRIWVTSSAICMGNFVPLPLRFVNARISGVPGPCEVDADAYADNGFVVLRSFATKAEADQLLTAAIDLARRHERGEVEPPTFVSPEQNLANREAPQPEDAASKVFRI